MSSLLPVPTPAARARDLMTAPPSDRRVDMSAKAFASSLAVARAEPARVDRVDGAAARSRAELPQQRAQVQSMMLSGAMKYAATRRTPTSSASGADAAGAARTSDAAADASRPGAPSLTAASAPVVLAADTPSNAAASAPAVLATDTPSDVAVVRAGAPHTDSLDASHPLAALRAQLREAMTVTSLPASVPAGRTRIDVVEAADMPAPVITDLTGTAAATVAALQLLATLPLPMKAAHVDAESTLPGGDATQDSDADDGMLQLDDSTPSHDDAKSPVLVEDHFDAPAAAIDTTTATTIAGATYVHLPAPTTSIATHATLVAPAHAPQAASGATSSHSAAPAAAIERADVHDVEKALAQLAPEFRARLQRVMDRMTSEYGHSVSVVETVRTQARQDALFAQGRTTDGPVVTWTTNSKHVTGLAADVMVDGMWNNPAGYAHLAIVAKQEGLRTLGARDPGHLELASESTVSADTLDALLGDLRGAPGDTARPLRADVHGEGRSDSQASVMARVANVAQVARVASVAEVARVATVAAPGASSRGAGSSNGGDAVSPLAVSGAMPMMTTDASMAPRVLAPTASVNMADRISQLMDIQATQSARPLSSVLLRMENANGLEDQIRIDTRGTAVDARLGVGTAQQAAAITDRLGELREALERRGLSADGVRAQAAPRATDSVHFSRTTAPGIELAGLRAASDSQSQGNTRDQSSRDQQQREAFTRAQDRHNPRSSTDDSRHRSRREQPEDRR